MSYDDFKANKWKPYESLTNDKKPDSCRIQYDGMEFSIKTDDKEVNQIIKNDVFLISVDGQLFINSRKLRDDDGAVLPISKYTCPTLQGRQTLRHQLQGDVGRCARPGEPWA